MGTHCHVVVVGGDPGLADRAVHQVDALESRWSRFRPGSDVSRLNAAAGRPVPVHHDTMGLLERAVTARTGTDGWFDPFLVRHLEAAGYDRDLAELAPPPLVAGRTTTPIGPSAHGEPLRERAPIELHRRRGTARLLGGAGFDPGGIGKGLAADLVSGWLLAHGADGALVNLGGDLRVRGPAPDGGVWRVGVDDPLAARPTDISHTGDGDGPATGPSVATVELSDAGLCTSSPLRRRWTAPDGTPAHHVLDPRTGRPGPVEVASVTVTAPEAWRAEALATAVLLAGPVFGAALLRRNGADGLAVALGGCVGPV